MTISFELLAELHALRVAAGVPVNTPHTELMGVIQRVVARDAASLKLAEAQGFELDRIESLIADWEPRTAPSEDAYEDGKATALMEVCLALRAIVAPS